MAALRISKKQLGHTVSGQMQNGFTPLSTQLKQQGIVLQQGL